ncbi:GNAT family N-acetyltransferase [Cellulomonas sp. DKR-3]|uniref:GNAT family N-acetyltransferase n=1 Tax=Cellulomonas fulva TaxID=2835530 RepID=A0ABS5TX53_9CELL|nr:GNAT family N-acetyltransferase [Cellulomonas fulva]MBT0993731.1 GNAT family N-acetyltransferase [Cellulomonas fulva]
MTTVDVAAWGAGPQPTLEADGLVLRPWRAADAPAVRAVYADPAIQRWHARRLDSDEEAAEVVERWRGAWAAGSGAGWAVVDAAGALLGRVNLKLVSAEDGVAELGYWTAPDARGQGVCSRAVRAMTGWAVAQGVHRLEIEHSVGNAASCRAAERSGFPLEATRRSSARHADGWHDMHVHVLLSPTDR